MQFFKIHKFASVISIWPIWTDLTLLNCKIVDCTSLIIVITSHATHTHINYCNLPHGHLLMMVELSGAQCFVRLTLDYIQIEVAHEFTVCWQLKSTSRNEILLCLKLLAAVIVFVIVARVELFIYRVVGRVLSLSVYLCPLFTASKHDNARRWYASAVHEFKWCCSYGSPPHHHITHSIIHTQEDKNNGDFYFSRANMQECVDLSNLPVCCGENCCGRLLFWVGFICPPAELMNWWGQQQKRVMNSNRRNHSFLAMKHSNITMWHDEPIITRRNNEEPCFQ